MSQYPSALPETAGLFFGLETEKAARVSGDL
jgi:hypothetical protein